MGKEKQPKSKKDGNFKQAVKGLIVLFGVASTYLMAGIIYMGANNIVAYCVTIPAVAIATYVLAHSFVKAFTK